MNGGRSVIKVFLVNGESRSLRLDERMDVTVCVKGVSDRDVALVKPLMSSISSVWESVNQLKCCDNGTFTLLAYTELPALMFL